MVSELTECQEYFKKKDNKLDFSKGPNILNYTTDISKLLYQHLLQGNLIGLPTETVYGLGANAFSPIGIDSIFHWKKRPRNSPLIVHVHSLNSIIDFIKHSPVHSQVFNSSQYNYLQENISNNKICDININNSISYNANSIPILLKTDNLVQESSSNNDSITATIENISNYISFSSDKINEDSTQLYNIKEKIDNEKSPLLYSKDFAISTNSSNTIEYDSDVHNLLYNKKSSFSSFCEKMKFGKNSKMDRILFQNLYVIKCTLLMSYSLLFQNMNILDQTRILFGCSDIWIDGLYQAVLSLGESFTPGPISMILPTDKRLLYNNPNGWSALRIPSHPIAKNILESVNLPIVAPSANVHKHVSPVTAEHVLSEFSDRQEPFPIFDGGRCSHGVESTMIAIGVGHWLPNSEKIMTNPELRDNSYWICSNKKNINSFPLWLYNLAAKINIFTGRFLYSYIDAVLNNDFINLPNLKNNISSQLDFDQYLRNQIDSLSESVINANESIYNKDLVYEVITHELKTGSKDNINLCIPLAISVIDISCEKNVEVMKLNLSLEGYDLSNCSILDTFFQLNKILYYNDIINCILSQLNISSTNIFSKFYNELIHNIINSKEINLLNLFDSLKDQNLTFDSVENILNENSLLSQCAFLLQYSFPNVINVRNKILQLMKHEQNIDLKQIYLIVENTLKNMGLISVKLLVSQLFVVKDEDTLRTTQEILKEYIFTLSTVKNEIDTTEITLESKDFANMPVGTRTYSELIQNEKANYKSNHEMEYKHLESLINKLVYKSNQDEQIKLLKHVINIYFISLIKSKYESTIPSFNLIHSNSVWQYDSKNTLDQSVMTSKTEDLPLTENIVQNNLESNTFNLSDILDNRVITEHSLLKKEIQKYLDIIHYTKDYNVKNSININAIQMSTDKDNEFLIDDLTILIRNIDQKTESREISNLLLEYNNNISDNICLSPLLINIALMRYGSISINQIKKTLDSINLEGRIYDCVWDDGTKLNVSSETNITHYSIRSNTFLVKLKTFNHCLKTNEENTAYAILCYTEFPILENSSEIYVKNIIINDNTNSRLALYNLYSDLRDIELFLDDAPQMSKKLIIIVPDSCSDENFTLLGSKLLRVASGRVMISNGTISFISRWADMLKI